METSMCETHMAIRTAYVWRDNTLSLLEYLALEWRYGATCWAARLRGASPLHERLVPTRLLRLNEDT